MTKKSRQSTIKIANQLDKAKFFLLQLYFNHLLEWNCGPTSKKHFLHWHLGVRQII